MNVNSYEKMNTSFVDVSTECVAIDLLILYFQNMANEASNGIPKEASDKPNVFLDFLNGINWNRPLERSASDCPWITPEEFKQTYMHKFMNYQCEENYFDPTNPLVNGENISDLRENENRMQSKKPGKSGFDKFSHIQQSVTEIKASTPEDEKNEDGKEGDDDEDDFIDEFGNIKDPDMEPPPSANSKSFKKPKNESPMKKSEIAKRSDPAKFNNGNKPSKSPSKFQQNKDHHQSHRAAERHAERPLLNWVDHDNVNSAVLKREKENPFQLKVHLQIKPSILTVSSQREYNELSWQCKSNSYNVHAFDQLKSYREVVDAEQASYQEFAKEYFEANPVELTENQRKYAESKIKKRLDRIKTLSKKYVDAIPQNDSMIRLLPMYNEQQVVPQYEMRIEQTILELVSEVYFDIFKNV